MQILQATCVQGRSQRHRRLLQAPPRRSPQELERTLPGARRLNGGGGGVVGGDAWGQPQGDRVKPCQFNLLLS